MHHEVVWCGVPGEADAHSVNQPLSCTRQRSPRPPAGGFQQRTSELRGIAAVTDAPAFGGAETLLAQREV